MADITVQVSSAGLTTYGSSSWGSFSYGGNQQPNVTVQSGTEAFPNQGWGSDSWGVENWGESGNLVSLTGLELSLDSGATETWGQDAWNASSTEWGGPFITQVAIGQQIIETGQELNSNVGAVGVTSATEVFLSLKILYYYFMHASFQYMICTTSVPVTLLSVCGQIMFVVTVMLDKWPRITASPSVTL